MLEEGAAGEVFAAGLSGVPHGRLVFWQDRAHVHCNRTYAMSVRAFEIEFGESKCYFEFPR
jgi:hypothetical protein